MDKMCNKSETEDLSKTITNSEESEILKRSESPVFKCVNTKTSRVPDSSDYDIPSYQINQSLKSRTSSKCENETNDFGLPFSPIFSPIQTNTLQFQPPSIHSLGTVLKNTDKAKTKVKTKVKETEQQCVLQGLGMNDKDISWVSSMASPPPKQLPGCEYNTIEKATFFPEEKFQNIQPRALFSQTSVNDFGCQPFSSDSDEDEAYKTNIRLSDVCATLKQLEFKSLSFECDVKDNSVNFTSSPVIKMKKFDESSKKKNQAILVTSPKDSYEFSCSGSALDTAKDGSAMIEDDSFQGMSFSCLDDLCKTITEKVETKPVSVEKKFYLSKSSDIYKVSSLDELYSYARTLEQGDTTTANGRKLKKSEVDTNLVRLDELKDSKVDATKRLYSEVSQAKDECNEKKVKVTDDGWENMKEYLSESQLNVSDSEIFRTVENLEKTLASQESRELNLGIEASQEKIKEEEHKQIPYDTCQEADPKTKPPICGTLQVAFATASGAGISVSEKSLAKARQMLKDCDEENPQMGFSTVSGKVIQVSDKALDKAKTLMLECEGDAPSRVVSTRTERLNRLRVSAEALEKAKALMEDCEKSVKTQNLELSKALQMKKYERVESNIPNFQGFPMGKTLQVPPEKSKDLTLNHEKSATFKVNKQNMLDGFSTDSSKQNYEEELDKVVNTGFWKPPGEKNEVCFEAVGNAEPENLSKLSFQSFFTGSGKEIKVSSEALKKAKALMEDCDKDAASEASEKVKPNKLNSMNFQGFLPGSGKQIKASDEPLKKAKTLMADCCGERSTDEIPNVAANKIKPVEMIEDSFPGFSTGSGKTVQVSREALSKAKRIMKSESIDELASMWMDELANESFGEIKIPEGGEQTESLPSTANAQVEAEIKNLEELKSATEGDEWDEIIPNWLHVYNTSPSIASDRLELSPLVSHESGSASKTEREYIKSPVLGVGDRFYRKIKKRKLEFAEEPTGDGSVRTTKRTSKLTLDFSVPFKKAKLLEVVTVGVDVKTERQRARERQEKVIKEKEKVKPLKGLLLSRKCMEKRINWAEAVGGSSPEVHSEESLKGMGVGEDVRRVRIDNAADFRFGGEDFFGSRCQNNIEGMPLGDGCLVILDDGNRFGVEEVKRAFLAAPGVQPNLLPFGWVENHYKWIVWKLAHYEKSFPKYFAGRCLTPNNVMLQLKYRYDREIDRNERSALKKILERDDTSLKRMVLCICGMRKVTVGETSGYELSLTDGWYSCQARVDAAMSRLIEEGKLCIGTKLMTQGATLVNCEQGVSPLEMGRDIYLKISTNSTRRVKWDTKLGFQKNPENFPISLRSILSQGGAISRLDVIIVRVYPVLYMEKTPDGHHVTRNRRSEEKAEAEYKKIQERRMEKICNEVRSEMRSALEKSKSEGRFSGAKYEERLNLVSGCSDSMVLRDTLTEDNLFGREFSDRVEKKLKDEKLDKRNVSAFLRVKIVDFRKPDYNNPAVLSIWNPNEDLLAVLLEGKVLSLMNVSVSNSSRTYKTLQINTTRQTQFRPINRTVKYPARKFTRLIDVSSKICPAFEEVDVVGMVALIRDESYGSRLAQAVYLTDFEFHFVGIVFWGSCRDYGWENVLKVRSIVACSNLQWKKTVSAKEVPSLHVSENSVFTENPRQDYWKEEIARLKDAIPKDLENFLSKCEEELTVKLEEAKWAGNRSLDNSKWHLSNGFETRPTASSTPIKPLPIRMSPGVCSEPSPIQKRIEKLQSYGEPPSLIPLLVRNRKVRKKS